MACNGIRRFWFHQNGTRCNGMTHWRAVSPALFSLHHTGSVLRRGCGARRLMGRGGGSRRQGCVKPSRWSLDCQRLSPWHGRGGWMRGPLCVFSPAAVPVGGIAAWPHWKHACSKTMNREDVSAWMTARGQGNAPMTATGDQVWQLLSPRACLPSPRVTAGCAL